MPAGVPTDEEKVAEFRAHYLLSGNAAKSARAVGIPERTGRDLAQRLSVDPSFAADRRLLRDQYLAELIRMRMTVARIALKRLRDGFADVMGGEGNVTIIDKRPEYGKLVLDAEKNAQNLARIDAESAALLKPDATGDGVTITISRASVEPDGS